ncbi:uncharacterized protein JCM6883_007085 [Sporobolomyces salmoneus]|uniref:uncharacterized protein n=1 Tax=Sporobolomyces salmoneus TaxID=183962 RepID=UPI00317E6CD4
MSRLSTDDAKVLLHRLDESLNAQQTSLEEISSVIKQLRNQLEATARSETIFDDPFPLLKVLSPSFASPSIRNESHSIVEQVCEVSSPKEIIVGLEELLAEMKFNEEETDDKNSESVSGERDLETALYSLSVYVRAYQKCLKRLKTAKPDKFYATAFDTISSVVTYLVVEGSFPMHDVSSEYLLDLEVVEAIFNLASQVGETQGEQPRLTAQESARSFIETVVGLLNPLLACDNANQFFLTLEPRYRPPQTMQPPPSPREVSTKRIWTSLFPTMFRSLDYKLDDLLIACKFSDPLHRTGSFSLLSHYLSLHSETPLPAFDIDEDTPATPTFLLSATLETIKRSLQPQTAYKIAEGDILFFLWWCIDQQAKSESQGAGFEENLLYSLVEVLSSLSALSPNPQTRFLAFRLLSRVILDLEQTGTPAQAEATQLALLKELLTDENATPSFKTACIEIVKELIDSKLSQGPTRTPILGTPRFLEEFESILFRFSPPDLLDTPISPQDFVEQHQRDVAQKLNFYYFLLTRDQENRTGIRSPLRINTTQNDFLDPLRRQLTTWLRTKLDPSVSLEFELLGISLSRVDEVLKALS